MPISFELRTEHFLFSINRDGTVLKFGRRVAEEPRLLGEAQPDSQSCKDFSPEKLTEFLNLVLYFIQNNPELNNNEIIEILETRMNEKEIAVLKAFVTTLQQFAPSIVTVSTAIDAEEHWIRRKLELIALIPQIREGLNNGLSKRQMVAEIIEAERVGVESENAVTAALTELSIVKKVIRFSKWSNEDRIEKVDLEVHLHNTNEYGIDTVFIQVKSSIISIEKSIEALIRTSECPVGWNAEAVYRWLATQRKIFLLGKDLSSEEIQENFLFELHNLSKLVFESTEEPIKFTETVNSVATATDFKITTTIG